ncbi:MAG: error-prone DNA polymerase [Candidatus Sericytochromatia bacterium]|nr:error-prone DNA polymerase [Candidatus Tanganyikabacteria bacterium]
MTYVELRAKSAFSFLDGASVPEELIARAKELGYPALALTDRDGLYGAPRFYKEARHAGVRALVGADLLVVESFEAFHAAAKKARTPDDVPGSRLAVLVTDRPAYKRLCRLLTLAKSRLTKPQATEFGAPLTWEELGAGCEGLFALVPPDGAGQYERAVAAFGPRDVAFEVRRHRQREDERHNRAALDAARRLGVDVVATNDVRYASPDRAALHDVLTCIRYKTTLEEAGERRLPLHAERYLKAPLEMERLFRDLPEALRASLAIAERCAFTLEDLGYRFPDYPLPPGKTPMDRLRDLVAAGCPRRYPDGVPPAVTAQVARELALIEKLDLPGYFLIVEDIVRFCRERGILVQGRGSAANSVVCYVLGITAVDPVARGLLFERFLSEDRGEWPDIDLDLPSGDLREEAIQYVYRRYGAPSGAATDGGKSAGWGTDNTPSGAAMTANVITYRGRSAVRDVGKVLGFAPEVLDRVSKSFFHHDMADRAATLARLEEAGIDPRHPRTLQLLALTSQIQHLPRHLGQHSGGMVVCQGRLDEVVPLEPATMPGRTVIVWDKEDCADLGILKIDLLGLGMMGVLQDAQPMIARYEGVAVDYGRLPDDDPAIWDMLCEADTVGVFQVESRAQMNILPRLRPRRFYDLVVSIGLIRPGPITGQMVSPFMERRAGRQEVTYPHPDLVPVLERTLGVPIFQEQVMKMSMVMAGFTGAQAERVRRAMGFKRSVEAMSDIERELRDGMAARGVTGPMADEVVKHITSFAQYGFPEAHSFSFALIAYATAYLKAHHPEAFLACLLNNWPMGFYHPSTLIRDAQRHGVAVRPVDVTRSDWNCTLEATGEPASEPLAGPAPASKPGRSQGRLAVRLGFRYVQHLREAAAQAVCAARAERPFGSLADFMRRVPLHGDEVEQLAAIGALAPLMPPGTAGGGRREALWQVQGLADYRRGLLAGAEPADEPFELETMSPMEELVADIRGTGVSTGEHPMSFARDDLRRRGILAAADLPAVPSGQWVQVGGTVIVRNRPPTAKGMLFLSLEDETGLVNVVCTPDVYDRHRSAILTSGALVIGGRLERRDGVTNIRAEQAEPLRTSGFKVVSRDFR